MRTAYDGVSSTKDFWETAYRYVKRIGTLSRRIRVRQQLGSSIPKLCDSRDLSFVNNRPHFLELSVNIQGQSKSYLRRSQLPVRRPVQRRRQAVLRTIAVPTLPAVLLQQLPMQEIRSQEAFQATFPCILAFVCNEVLY
jgi:hypothetical protein